MGMIEANVAAVRARLERAVASAGRDPGEVALMAVSKNHGPDAVREAYQAGLDLFGENRVQEAAAKIPESPGGAHWHLIGHLQRNKVRPAVELFACIHSVDSLRLVEALQQACEAASRRLRILLEVNVSGESVKFGFSPGEVPGLLRRAGEFGRLEMEGLMTIPPLTEDPEGARPHFRALREYRDRWQQETGYPLPVLSMGMSHDLEVAVEEGSNVVRVGTAIFGPRPKRVVNEEDI
jgi:pyridoxal phosphate enzyme (YggS family)